MLLFIFALCCRSETPFSALVKEAKDNALKRKTLALLDEDIFPGDYKGKTYSYHVIKRLTGLTSRNIAGVAFSDSHIAILPSKVRALKSNEETESVFVNGDLEKMYNLKYVETDEDVRIFETQEVNPFEIVTSITFSTRSNWKSQITEKLNLNWAENEDPFTKGRPDNAKEICTGVSYATGFYSEATIDLEAKLNGITSFSLSATLKINSIMGITLDINNPTFEKELYTLFSKPFPIKTPLSFSILGFGFGIPINVEIALDIADIKLQLQLQFQMYKGYYIEFEKKFAVSSERGFENPDHKFEIKEFSKGDDFDTVFNEIRF